MSANLALCDVNKRARIAVLQEGAATFPLVAHPADPSAAAGAAAAAVAVAAAFVVAATAAAAAVAATAATTLWGVSITNAAASDRAVVATLFPLRVGRLHESQELRGGLHPGGFCEVIPWSTEDGGWGMVGLSSGN